MQTRLRYNRVHVADNTDDQHDATEISSALVTSETQEDLQEFVLSQIKRLIHGDAAGNWYTHFINQGVLSMLELTTAFSMPAQCLSGDLVGDIVYIRGDRVGGVIQVTKVDITDWNKMPSMGFITSKSTSTDCIIVRYGLVSVGTLTPGKTYFAGHDSRPTSVPPVAIGGQKAFVQPLGVAVDSNRLLFNPSLNITRVIP